MVFLVQAWTESPVFQPLLLKPEFCQVSLKDSSFLTAGLSTSVDKDLFTSPAFKWGWISPSLFCEVLKWGCAIAKCHHKHIQWTYQWHLCGTLMSHLITRNKPFTMGWKENAQPKKLLYNLSIITPDREKSWICMKIEAGKKGDVYLVLWLDEMEGETELSSRVIIGRNVKKKATYQKRRRVQQTEGKRTP